jgi:hypothetical protein
MLLDLVCFGSISDRLEAGAGGGFFPPALEVSVFSSIARFEPAWFSVLDWMNPRSSPSEGRIFRV